MKKNLKSTNNSVGSLLEEIKEQDINMDKSGATTPMTVTVLTTLTAVTLTHVKKNCSIS